MNDEQVNESTSEQINTGTMKGILEGDKATLGAELNPASHPRVHNPEVGGTNPPTHHPTTQERVKSTWLLNLAGGGKKRDSNQSGGDQRG